MNYGIQISASGVQTALHRQDVLANNLANINTPGFKADIPATVARRSAREEDGLFSLPSNKLLEKLGAGVLAAPPKTEFEQGPIESNRGPLDLAIRGRGFFVVRDSTSGTANTVRLTRDGRFSRDGSGRLVMAATGMPVLDASNQPIVITGSGAVAIDGDGTVRQNGQEVGKIAVVDVADYSGLNKVGNNLFRASASALASKRPASGEVMQHSVEHSSVDEVSTILAITEAGRDVEINMSMVAYQDRMNERAINSLARVV